VPGAIRAAQNRAHPSDQLVVDERFAVRGFV
jgi:hypothetical protein